MAKQKSNTAQSRVIASNKPDSTLKPDTGKAAVAPAKKRGLARLRPKRHVKPASMPNRLPGAFAITKKAMLTLWSDKKTFLGVAAFYGILSFALVRGFSSVASLNESKELVDGVSGSGPLTTGLALFSVLLTSSASASSDSTNLMQMILLVITSLAIVWLLRHVMAGEKVRIRDGYYKGMYPLIPVLLLFLVIFLQTVPLLAGGSLFSVLVGNAIAITWLEILLASIIFFSLLVLSLYWLSSSVIALYIATLPDMTPFKALRSAADLVRWRRWSVLRKLVFLPFALLLVAATIMLPFLVFATPVAPYIYAVLSMVGILVVHAYLYTLYRELLA